MPLIADAIAPSPPGDKLLLTSTDYDWKQAEEAEVVYCSPQQCSNNQVKVLRKFSPSAILC